MSVIVSMDSSSSSRSDDRSSLHDSCSEFEEQAESANSSSSSSSCSQPDSASESLYGCYICDDEYAYVLLLSCDACNVSVCKPCIAWDGAKRYCKVCWPGSQECKDLLADFRQFEAGQTWPRGKKESYEQDVQPGYFPDKWQFLDKSKGAKHAQVLKQRVEINRL